MVVAAIFLAVWVTALNNTRINIVQIMTIMVCKKIVQLNCRYPSWLIYLSVCHSFNLYVDWTLNVPWISCWWGNAGILGCITVTFSVCWSDSSGSHMVKMWISVVTTLLYRLIGGYQLFWGMYCLHFQGRVVTT